MKRNGVFDAAAACQMIYGVTLWSTGDHAEHDGNFFSFLTADGSAPNRNAILESLLAYWQAPLYDGHGVASKGFFLRNADLRFVPASKGVLQDAKSEPIVGLAAPSRESLQHQQDATKALLHRLGICSGSTPTLRGLVKAAEEIAASTAPSHLGAFVTRIADLFTSKTARTHRSKQISDQSGPRPCMDAPVGVGAVKSVLMIESIARRVGASGLEDLASYEKTLSDFRHAFENDPQESLLALERNVAKIRAGRDKLIASLSAYYDEVDSLANTRFALIDVSAVYKQEVRFASAAVSAFRHAREACLVSDLGPDSLAKMKTAEALAFKLFDWDWVAQTEGFSLHALLLRSCIERQIALHQNVIDKMRRAIDCNVVTLRVRTADSAPS